MRFATALRLGRVSNLPTTFSNVVAGLALSGAVWEPVLLLGLCAAIASLYVGGMYLNDAFDREHDARERPERPIPSGEVTASTVFALGFGMLALGVAIVAALAFLRDQGTGLMAVLVALLLAAVIVFYDLHHKRNRWSPLVMACTRALVYVIAALSVRVELSRALETGVLLLLSYLIGLTYLAKQENLRSLRRVWPLFFLLAPIAYAPVVTQGFALMLGVVLLAWIAYSLRWLFDRQRRDVKRAVTQLIAGISLLDALLVANAGQTSAALFCVLCCAATLILQRYVAGT